MYDIEIYKTRAGKVPYIEWERQLDKITLARIDARFARIRNGNLGTYRSIGNGIFELKFDFGPGYRIYFGFRTDKVLVLLVGGHKTSQAKDISKAKEFWHDHLLKEEKNEKI